MVSGKYTTTGMPLLANDPHLAPMMPSLWYQMGLHCRTISSTCGYDVAGYTFSGMPGVIIGHNQDVSWGFTNLGADVTDLYLEKISGNNYLYDNQEKPSPPARRSSRSPEDPARPSPSARPTTAPWSPTATTSWRRSARRRPSTPPPPTGAPATRWP